jgi:hypothetical protein
VFLCLFCHSSFAQTADKSDLPKVMANDNRTPAGQLTNGVLELRMTLDQAAWYPEEDSGGQREVYAFAEEGHAPQSSGPLIRAPQGTQIRISIHNSLPLGRKSTACTAIPATQKMC